MKTAGATILFGADFDCVVRRETFVERSGTISQLCRWRTPLGKDNKSLPVFETCLIDSGELRLILKLLTKTLQAHLRRKALLEQRSAT